MDIQYEQLNKWIQVSESFYNYSPEDVIGEDKLHSYINGKMPTLTDEEVIKINDDNQKLSTANDSNEMWLEITREIDYNIANIPTMEQIKRYLAYIRKRIELTISLTNDSLEYDWIIQSEIRFRPLFEDLSDDRKDELGEKGSIILEVSERGDDGPIGRYLQTCVHTAESYHELLNEIIERETNREDLQGIVNELELPADRHRLLLLHQTGAFDFLLTKYMDPKRPIMNLEGFSKLIHGITNPKGKDLRSDVGRLKNEIDSPNMKKVIQNGPAIKNVNSFLASLGLPTA